MLYLLLQVMEIAIEFPYCGENIVRQIVHDYGIRVTRSRIRDSIHRVDVNGAISRSGRLHRHHLWPIDTNHKLVRWSFIIVGGVDGYSRLPVMLQCTSNNKAPTMLSCFQTAVNTNGLPSRVRSDKGLENVHIELHGTKQLHNGYRVWMD